MNEKSDWKKLTSGEVFKTPVFSIIRERSKSVRTGAETDFYFFKCPDWVNIIAVTKDNKLVMIKQYRHGSGRVEMEIPGGCIETNEDPVLAGERELFEETGYRGSRGRIIGKVCPNPALQGNNCYTILVTDATKESEAAMEETETIETIPVPVEDVNDLIKEKKITHGLVLNALHFWTLNTTQKNQGE